MSLPAHRIMTAPRVAGKILTNDGPWTSDLPKLVGRPTVMRSKYKLRVKVYGTTGAIGCYLEYKWWDLDLFPSGTPDYYLLFGQHIVDGDWDGESPFYIGFGCSVRLPSDYATGGSRTWNLTFAGRMEVPGDWAEIELASGKETNPALTLVGVQSGSQQQKTASGRVIQTGRFGGIRLGFDQDRVQASIRGTISLAEAIRSSVVVLPDYDETTRLSVPLTVTSIPDVGPIPIRREDIDQYLLTAPTLHHGTRLVMTAKDHVDRIAPHDQLGAIIHEPAGENECTVSTLETGFGGEWSSPITGLGDNFTANISSYSTAYPFADPLVLGGALWRKGNDTSAFTRTFTNLGNSGETWVFSCYVRGHSNSDGKIKIYIGTDVEEYVLTDEWQRIQVSHTCTSTPETMVAKIYLELEGDVVWMNGCQMELRHTTACVARATSLIPRKFGSEYRAADSRKYRVALSGDEGTVSVVFRWPGEGGNPGGGSPYDPVIPLLGFWNATSSQYDWMLVISQGNGTNHLVGMVPRTGTELVVTTAASLQAGELCHLAMTLFPTRILSTTYLGVAFYLNGTSIGGSALATPTPERFGDEIHVGPNASLNTRNSIAMMPFAGEIEKVRYDGRFWSPTEISKHSELRTSETGRDLVYLTEGRRFFLETGYAQVPGADIYTMIQLRMNQHDRLVPSDSPVDQFYTYQGADPLGWGEGPIGGGI